MAKRKIIKIDEELCNGCGLCIPNCPEGAIQIINDKARLMSDLFCDGLGACIGNCPQGAITIEEREAEEYDEKRVMENIVKHDQNVIDAHLKHLKDHGQAEYLAQATNFLNSKNIEAPTDHTSGCSGSRVVCFGKDEASPKKKPRRARVESQLRQWPVQIMLIPTNAPYLDQSDLLIAADCVPFAYANFHEDFLKEKTLLVGCPKLDDSEIYREKLSQIIKNRNIKSITCAHMEVPCCFGLVSLIKSAIAESGKNIPFHQAVINIKGERIK